MNAAAALLAADKVTDLAEGVTLARESIDTGRALATLEQLIVVSQRLGETERSRIAEESA
jgi:anthranilate phosphoribosyltransferase